MLVSDLVIGKAAYPLLIVLQVQYLRVIQLSSSYSEQVGAAFHQSNCYLLLLVAILTFI